MSFLQVIDVAAAVRSIPFRGGEHLCPCCGWSLRRFTSGGQSVRAKQDGYCPRCNSKPRHRWLWLNLPEQFQGSGVRDLSVLHIAPAHSTFRAFSRLPLAQYVTAGIDNSSRLTMRMDLTKPAIVSRFDVVVCIHVLEHLDDDGAAMSSLANLVKPDGVVFVGVPTLVDEPTREDDPTITDAEERVRRFGEPDHRRWYGIDIEERLSRAGFEVQTLLSDHAPDEQRARHGLKGGEGLFVCRPRF